MSDNSVKEDPVKLHKDGNTLYELGKYKEAKKSFLCASELYRKSNNFFDAASMLYKSGECAYMLKDNKAAIDHFHECAELSFSKGFDRFGVSALEYERDCFRALNNEKKVKELEKKIAEVKEELSKSF